MHAIIAENENAVEKQKQVEPENKLEQHKNEHVQQN